MILLNFNPRTREGCDSPLVTYIQKTNNFNPRTREGCDGILGFGIVVDILHFNPRTREGCDEDMMNSVSSAAFISIHAPVKGATQAELADKLKIGNFNPRTREGCDIRQSASGCSR